MANSNASMKVVGCTCVHPFQDGLYGKNRRMANPKAVGTDKDKQLYTCTVCSKEH